MMALPVSASAPLPARRPGGWRWWASAALLMSGCNASRVESAAAGPPAVPAPSRTSLENGQPSLRALAELALEAVKAGDTAALNSLRVTEKEYKEIFFPEFPQAGPGHNIPVDFHWYHLNLRSLKGIHDVIDGHADHDYELLDIVATEGIEEFKTFRAHKKVELKVRSVRQGGEQQVRLFGSVLERAGEFKLLSFPS